jgi:hypothetical protein
MPCPACSGPAPGPMIVTSRTVSVSMTSAFMTPSTRESGSVSRIASGSTLASSGIVVAPEMARSGLGRSVATSLIRRPSLVACLIASGLLPVIPRRKT